MSSDRPPRKRFWRGRGCGFWLLNVLVSCGVCYASMWLFARFGGEWATQYDMPVPGSGHHIAAQYGPDSSGDYMRRQDLFISESTPEELREWFIQVGVPMTPILLDAERNSYIDQPDYLFEQPLYHRRTTFQEFHRLSAFITAGWLDEISHGCQGVRVYRNNSAVSTEFPSYTVPEGYTAFMVSTCWPDVR